MAPDADPKDVADMLESLAKRIRGDPALSRATAPHDPRALALATHTGASEETGPSMGAFDILSDDRHVTVTIETHNADAASVHVSLLAGRLLIGLGEGPLACKRDVPLPAVVDEEAAIATFRNGILDVVLPIKR